jgi:DNA-binding SARP family transcriptional activator/tetratricopeptide (TPR) repeat protein
VAPALTTFGVLGRLEVRRGGTPVFVGRRRERALIGLLLLEAGKAVSLDRLADLLWDGDPPMSAAAAVHTHMSRLRAALDPDRTGQQGLRLHTADGGYRAEVDLARVDVHRFTAIVADARRTTDIGRRAELLHAAGALWRGPLLEDCGSDLLRQRVGVELDELRLTTLESALDAELDLGRHEDAVGKLVSLTARYPLRERLWALLTLALYRCDRRVEALETLARARAYLVAEAGVDPGIALRQLQQRILHSDPTLLDIPAGRATPAPVVPRQLPPTPDLFVGRADPLVDLDHAMAASAGPAVVISAISGAGGIGKTWLALHWAHRDAHRFPDGQLFVDLHGFSPDSDPLDPLTAVDGFLVALGVPPESIPADLDARTALYRSMTAGKRMLIVLDNAASTDQVEPLLPGTATCVTLVTSRRKLAALTTRYGAHHLQLDSLTHQEAHALLVRRLGRTRIAAERDAADELTHLCGNHPLALAIIATRARTRPQIPLTELADELRDLGVDALDRDTDPAASLPAVLSWSLHGLTTEQRTVFALLGVAPGPDIGLPAAASLVGLPTRRTSKILHTLEEASLLAQQPGGRYVMHDLIRDYAAATAHHHVTAPAKEQALRRVLDFYTHTAFAAQGLLDRHRQLVHLNPPAAGTHLQPPLDAPAAVAWFDRENGTLLAAQHTAATHSWHHTVWQLACVLNTFHYRRGHLHARLVMWRAALDAATHLSDHAAQIRAHRLLGRACADLGRHDEAVEHLHHALALTEHHRSPTEKAHTHRTLAWAWGQRGDHDRALAQATHALALFRTIDQPVWRAHALNTVGWHAAWLGDLNTARTHCQTALALHQRHHHLPGEADTLDSLGYIAHRTGKHHSAIRYYRQALTVYRGLTNAYQVADTLDRLGHPHAVLSHRDDARSAWQEALQLYQEQGRDHDAARVRRQLTTLDVPGD